MLKYRTRLLFGESAKWARRTAKGVKISETSGRCLLLVSRRIKRPPDVDEVLLVSEKLLQQVEDGANFTDLEEGEWLYPEPTGATVAERHALRENARESWGSAFAYRMERRQGPFVLEPGLRPPQLGALHAIQAHWTVGVEPATIVMPTGTGKTETMLATLIAEHPECLLVVVPTDPLRTQIVRKFLTLGVLPGADVVSEKVLFPLVTTLRRRPKTVDEVRAIFQGSNVVVATMAIAGGCTEDVQKAMAREATHLIIDEAHHISARTWSKFRKRFVGRPILQFTATPFRSDRKQVDGRVVYNYPLRKAQEEGLFKRVSFKAVQEFDTEDADLAIAKVACEQVVADTGSGLDHLVMARAETIARAEKVLEVYQKLEASRTALGESPIGAVVIHSGLTSQQRGDAFKRVEQRTARILVCVDMFGEGFDMPELKIAALHDMHKSLAITLQFTGRFTRVSHTLGDATVIANIAGARVEESLRELYAEDADWNVVLRDLSEGANRRHAHRVEFLSGFEPPPTFIPLQNVAPRMSTIIYRSEWAEWKPENIPDAMGPDRIHGEISVNQGSRIALFVTRELQAVSWGEIRELVNTIWDLHLVHFDHKRKLLFIHSSDDKSFHQGLAFALGGEKSSLLRGEQMFRGFHGLQRLVLMNLGLKHVLGRNIQFTMYAGSDILEQLPGAAQLNKTKSNMFGQGYEAGRRSSYGCSHRGRAWAYRRADDIEAWIKWCSETATKLVDASITTEAALKFALIPTQARERPKSAPLSILWPEEFMQRAEDLIEFRIGGTKCTLVDTTLTITEHSGIGPLRFQLLSSGVSAEYEVEFVGEDFRYRPLGDDVTMPVGSRTKLLSEVFHATPPDINFADGSVLSGNVLLQLRNDYRPPFIRDTIAAFDWTGVDIQKESQGLEKRPDSIQRRVIKDLTAHQPPHNIVFDDDNPGEAADVIAIRVDGEQLRVLFYHCKSSRQGHAGARVDDLYTLCGQAQTSVSWRGRMSRLLEHMERRESARLKAAKPSRFEVGSRTTLRKIRGQLDRLTPSLEVWLVQPGLSRTAASNDQLELLAVTQHYLQDTFGVALKILASA